MFALGTLLDGEPIINLPPKVVELKKVDFTEEERDFYTRLEIDSRAQFKVCFYWKSNLEIISIFFHISGYHVPFPSFFRKFNCNIVNVVNMLFLYSFCMQINQFFEPLHLFVRNMQLLELLNKIMLTSY
jgi:hypothetical protein